MSPARDQDGASASHALDGADPTPGADLADDEPFGRSKLHPLAILAVIAAVVPFALSIETTSTSGGITTSFNPVATIAGAIAVIGAIVVGVLAYRRDARARQPITLAAAVAALGVGGFHLATGGLF